MAKFLDRTTGLFLLALISLMGVLPGTVSASAVKPLNGITLSPFLEQLTINHTDSVKSFELQLTNHTSTVQELDLSTQDFGSLDNTGGILLEGSNTYTQKYGLVSWLTLENNTVILKPQESRSVLVSIDNRSSLQPGGHYGAVVATVNSLGKNGGNQVSVNQQLLSLILVDKQGGDHYDLSLVSVDQNGNWVHLPNDIRILFQNPGNVHVVPRGLVQLESPNNTVLAQGIINSDSAFVLPESFRQISVPLTPVGHSLPLPGNYHLVVHYRYDGLSSYAVKDYYVGFIDLKLYFSLGAILIIFCGAFRRRHRKQRTRLAVNTSKAGSTDDHQDESNHQQ